MRPRRQDPPATRWCNQLEPYRPKPEDDATTSEPVIDSRPAKGSLIALRRKLRISHENRNALKVAPPSTVLGIATQTFHNLPTPVVTTLVLNEDRHRRQCRSRCGLSTCRQ